MNNKSLKNFFIADPNKRSRKAGEEEEEEEDDEDYEDMVADSSYSLAPSLATMCSCTFLLLRLIKSLHHH